MTNKMKAEGFQKLHCQMCEKQCRDENDFKCHTMSETHQRQLLLFADAPAKFSHNFSKEFSDGYMELLRRRFGTKRVNANIIYQEYVAEKDHVHMNSTRWLTLSDYVKWLGRTGQAKADETDKGWFVTYIDRSPEAMERQTNAEKKEKTEKDDEERMMEFIEKQIGKAKAKEGEIQKDDKYTELVRDEEQPSQFRIPLQKKFQSEYLQQAPALIKKRMKDHGSDNEVDNEGFKKPKLIKRQMKRKDSSTTSTSSLDEIIKMEERKMERANRKDYWLHEGIVVKVISKFLGDKYYKQKAVVQKVIDKYEAQVTFLESGEKIKIDQAHLETVIPALDKLVMVVNGAYRGCEAILKKMDEKNYCMTIEISRGHLKGRIVDKLEYEDISKIY